MKKLAHYYGKVNRLGTPPEPSYVTLKDAATGNIVDTDAITQVLLDAKINEEGCHFEIIISEDLNGQIKNEISKINPQAPPPAILPDIKAKTREQLEKIDKIAQTPTRNQVTNRTYRRIRTKNSQTTKLLDKMKFTKIN